MEPNQAGITALVTAYARAYHAAHDTPKIFDDFLAGQFFGPAERAGLDHNLSSAITMVDPEMAATQPDPAEALARVMQVQMGSTTLSRSRYTEDCLEEAVRQGARQYIILGAGLDTFAFRRPDLLERLDVFEVDHPVTQAMKRERIAAAGWAVPARLHFVAVDFAQEALSAALQRSAYDARQASFFSWLGVTYYLAREVIQETLRSLARISLPGSQLVFDFMDPAAFDPQMAGRRTQLTQTITRRAGEPMQGCLDPRQLAAELAVLGFDLLETLDPAEIEARYFQNRSDAYHASEHIHFARAAVR